MTATEYKQACAQPDVFLRGDIGGPVRLLSPDSDLATKLRMILVQDPIEKPLAHQGNHMADQFRVNLSEVDANTLVTALVEAKSAALSMAKENLPHHAFIARWIELWSAYRDYLRAKSNQV